MARSWASASRGQAARSSATTTTVSATPYRYDASAVALAGVQAFVAADATVAELSDVRVGSTRLPVEGRGAPTTSSRLVVATAEGSILNCGSKAAARGGLTGEAGAAANRFFRDATSKSIDFQAQELGNSGYRLQFFAPANNPGYGKLYGQEIDAAGNVIKEFKNTPGPDGLIETKWVHGGP